MRRLNLADELTGITAMVAEKFTNERTADGIQKALYLTVGCVSLGLENALHLENDQAALDFLVEHGAEQAFQVGFRLIKELSQLPEDALVGEYDQDPVYLARRLRELFIDICQADPNQNWSGAEKYALQLQQRKEVQAVVRLAGWLRRHHDHGPVSDSDLNAEGVIALAIIFAIEGGGRIVARTGPEGIRTLRALGTQEQARLRRRLGGAGGQGAGAASSGAAGAHSVVPPQLHRGA